MDDEKQIEGEQPEEKPKQAKSKPEPTPVPVRIIGTRGTSALVEWMADGDYYRAFVPANKVQDGRVDEAVLKRGVPYGVAWEEFIEITATPQALARELRKRGIFTFEELARNATVVHKINRAFDASVFLRKAKEAS